jgi:hypothetical protein
VSCDPEPKTGRGARAYPVGVFSFAREITAHLPNRISSLFPTNMPYKKNMFSSSFDASCLSLACDYVANVSYGAFSFGRKSWCKRVFGSLYSPG